MRRRINAMQGMIPRRESRLLGDRQAQKALDCRLFSGAIRSYKETEEVIADVTLEGIGTEDIWLWRAGGVEYWFRFPSPVEVIRGPVAGDVWERVYFSGDSRFDEPRYTYTPVAYDGGTDYPVTSYKLGVPAPEQAATVALTPGPTATVLDVFHERPIRVQTDAPHGFKEGQIVRFEITAAEPTGGENDLAEFLNFEEGFQISIVDDDEFTLDYTDALNIDYSDFSSGTVELYYPPGVQERRFYVHTYVTELGEEGPPSPASDAVDADPRQEATVTLGVVDSGAGTGRVLENRRVYRTASGASGADFFFVGEVGISETELVDTVETSQLGEVLPSGTWDPPPDDMRGFIVLPTGIVAGFSDNELILSEPNRPHAYPVDYRLTLEWPIVALGAIDTYIVAATSGQPYLVTGGDPRSMLPQMLETTAACVSARSMVSMGYSVMYAAVEGLVQVDRNGARVVTWGYLTPDEWSDYVPESIHAYEYQGRYMGFYDDGSGNKGGFIFDPREPELGFQELSFHAKSGHRDHEDDHLYLLTEENAIVRWDSHPTNLINYRWLSRKFAWPYPLNVGAARVIADSYNDLEFNAYAGDGSLLYSVEIESDDPFRLPSGHVDRHFAFDVQGTDVVQEIAFGETVEEISSW